MNSFLLIANNDAGAAEVTELLSADSLVVAACTVQAALPMLVYSTFDVVIVDVAVKQPPLAASDCMALREALPASALIVTATELSSELEEAVFAAGADEILPRSPGGTLLKQHIDLALARQSVQNASIMRFADLELDVLTGCVRKAGREIHLFPMEFKLLQFFLKHPKETFTSEALSQRLWHKSSRDSIRTYIKTLRRKIDSAGSPSIIRTDGRHGYGLRSA